MLGNLVTSYTERMDKNHEQGGVIKGTGRGGQGRHRAGCTYWGVSACNRRTV